MDTKKHGDDHLYSSDDVAVMMLLNTCTHTKQIYRKHVRIPRVLAPEALLLLPRRLFENLKDLVEGNILFLTTR